MAVVTAAGPVTAAADECCLRSLAPYRLREGAAVPNGTLREGVVPTSWHRSECVLGVRTGCGRCGRHERGCARLPPSQVNSAASRPAPASDTIGIVRCSASRLSRSRRYVTRPCRLLGMGAQRIAAFSLRGSRCSLWRRGSVTIVCALLVGSSSRAPSLGASLASVFGLGGVHHKTTTGEWVPRELKSRQPACAICEEGSRYASEVSCRRLGRRCRGVLVVPPEGGPHAGIGNRRDDRRRRCLGIGVGYCRDHRRCRCTRGPLPAG